MTERIIITFNRDGTFRGASATGFDDQPKSIQPKDLEALAPSINAALLATVDAKDAEIAKLQLGYVEPNLPTVDERIQEAIAAALTPDEQLTYAKRITDAKAHFCAFAVAEIKPKK